MADDAAFDPWNVLHQIRMLRWLFLEPEKIIAYREEYGPQGLRQTGAWLVSDIVWLALLAPLAGFLIGTIQIAGVESTTSTVILLALSAVLAVGGWFVTAWIGWHERQLAAITLLISMTALTFLSFYITAGIAGVALTGVGGITGLFNIVTIGLAIGSAAGIAFSFRQPHHWHIGRHDYQRDSGQRSDEFADQGRTGNRRGDDGCDGAGSRGHAGSSSQARPTYSSRGRAAGNDGDRTGADGLGLFPWRLGGVDVIAINAKFVIIMGRCKLKVLYADPYSD